MLILPSLSPTSGAQLLCSAAAPVYVSRKRERFDCAPMQFVKRQRLARAMERLREPAVDDTVARITRDCGYHYTSNFSTDFQRYYGIKPSVVLRSSRGGVDSCLPGEP